MSFFTSLSRNTQLHLLLLHFYFVFVYFFPPKMQFHPFTPIFDPPLPPLLHLAICLIQIKLANAANELLFQCKHLRPLFLSCLCHEVSIP